MHRAFFILIFSISVFLLPGAWIAQAQQSNAPDYTIRNIREGEGDDSSVIINFEIQNVGGAADEPTLAQLVLASTGTELPSTLSQLDEVTRQYTEIDAVPALVAGEIISVSLSTDVSNLPSGEVRLRAEVDAQAIGDADVDSNVGLIRITVEEPAQDDTGQAPATPGAVFPGETADDEETADGGFVIPFVEVEINPREITSDPLQLVLVVGVGGAVLVLLLLFIIIIRLLFRKKPEFGRWQPPYANMPYLNPDTHAGRRQQWQPHAQNNLIPAPMADDTYHIRKLLLGINGNNFSGWSVGALRISQYDMYGRVARSQVIGTNPAVKVLNKTMRRADRLSEEQIHRRVKPVGRRLVNAFFKRITKRSAMLPITLDLRFIGTHGEVRILFELFRSYQGYWQLVDSWDPEMTVTGKGIDESFSFTVHGMQPHESMRDFKKRLQEDVNALLCAMYQTTPTAVESAPGAPPSTQSQPAVEEDKLDERRYLPPDPNDAVTTEIKPIGGNRRD